MSNLNAFDEALSQLNDGGFVSKILNNAYDSARFKRYSKDVMSAQSGDREKAANEVIYQAAAKMTLQGGGLGFFGGLAPLVSGGADITSLGYHTVEMCGVMAEIYGFDTDDDSVKTLVLAGVAGDSDLTNRALELVKIMIMKPAARQKALKPLVKTLIVPILKAVGIKVGVKGGIKLMELIPVAGAVVGGGANFAIVNDTGHKFLERLEELHTLLEKKQQKRGWWQIL